MNSTALHHYGLGESSSDPLHWSGPPSNKTYSHQTHDSGSLGSRSRRVKIGPEHDRAAPYRSTRRGVFHLEPQKHERCSLTGPVRKQVVSDGCPFSPLNPCVTVLYRCRYTVSDIRRLMREAR